MLLSSGFVKGLVYPSCSLGRCLCSNLLLPEGRRTWGEPPVRPLLLAPPWSTEGGRLPPASQCQPHAGSRGIRTPGPLFSVLEWICEPGGLAGGAGRCCWWELVLLGTARS